MFFPPRDSGSDGSGQGPRHDSEHRLPGGLLLQVRDRSNRYFGDYHRICLDLSVPIPLTDSLLTTCRELCANFDPAGTTEVVFTKRLERMGVPGAEVERVKEELLRQFIESAGGYLGRIEFQAQFVLKELFRPAS